ncbi:MAG TPA: MFS transporter, partial [Acidobacteriota bacterium]
MKRELIIASIYGFVFTIALAVLIYLGSRNLSHFDAALVGYTFAVLFATFGIVYRYAMWLQRPPTAIYWKRGWQAFLNPKYLVVNFINWIKRLTSDIALNSFIFKRGSSRWLAHWLIMWGCITAGMIT